MSKLLRKRRPPSPPSSSIGDNHRLVQVNNNHSNASSSSCETSSTTIPEALLQGLAAVVVEAAAASSVPVVTATIPAMAPSSLKTPKAAAKPVKRGGGSSSKAKPTVKSKVTKKKPAKKTGATTGAAPPRKRKASADGPPKKKSKATIAKPKQIEGAEEEEHMDGIPQPVNQYDASLQEARDLMQAAMEAQLLGRLKMASAYQLLLHARLVGLGKVFDRATTVASETTTQDATLTAQDATTSSNVAGVASLETDEMSPNSNGSHASTAMAQSVLAKIMPSNAELDPTMLEHLAKAAMELHHKRTGRRMSPEKPTGIAWSRSELEQLHKAVEKYGRQDTAQIAKELGGSRTEAQIRAYLRNSLERERLAKAHQPPASPEQPVLPPGTEHSNASEGSGGTPTKRRGGKPKKLPTRAVHTVPNANLDARQMLLEGRDSL
eukprot:scaffold3165_cov48-Attheya_sp.AAC.2